MKQRPRQRQRIVYVEREQPQPQQEEQQELEVNVEAKEAHPELAKVTNSQNNKESKANKRTYNAELRCGIQKLTPIQAHTNTHTHQYTLRAIQHPQADGESLQDIGDHRQRLQHSRFASFSYSVVVVLLRSPFLHAILLFIYVFFAMVAHFVHFAVAAKRDFWLFCTALFFAHSD